MLLATNARIDDMLAAWGARYVAEAKAAAEKRHTTITVQAETRARSQGECMAWAVHDSFFVWKSLISNSFPELRDFVAKPGTHITTWSQLQVAALQTASHHLSRLTYSTIPALLTKEDKIYWWRCMAIAHQCYTHTKAIL